MNIMNFKEKCDAKCRSDVSVWLEELRSSEIYPPGIHICFSLAQYVLGE